MPDPETDIAASRLLELLEIREQELEEARERVSELERDIEFDVGWMRQEHTRKDEHDGLPVPRLQLRLVSSEHYAAEFEVALVHEMRGGRFARVPLSYSKRSGREEEYDFPETDATDEAQQRINFLLPTIVNDLCLAHDKMQLPAFVLLGDKVLKVASLRPLRFAYVS